MTGDSEPYTIIGLDPDTEYNFRVATRNAAGLSDYSAIQTFRTKGYHSSSCTPMLSLILYPLPLLLVRTV